MPTTYTLTVTPDGSLGDIDISLPAGVAQDAAGNDSEASNLEVVPYVDSTPPTIVVTAPDDHDGSTPFTATFTLSEAVPFTLGDIFVINGAASALTGGPLVYTATITPSGPNDAAVNVPAGNVTDANGNSNPASNTATTVYVDQAAPIVTVTVPPSHNGSAPYTATIEFNEPVTGLTLAGFTIANGTASNLVGSGTSYTVTITPTGNLDTTINVDAGAAVDSTGNGSNASSPAITAYVDSTAPTVVVSGPTSHNGSAPYTVNIVFDEPVTGFTLADVGVTGGAASALTGGGTTYQVTITPTGNANTTVSIAAGAAQDAGGNDNDASNAAVTAYVDSTGPLVDIAAPASHDGSAPVTVTITFTEPVTGFSLGDLVVAGASLSAFSGSGSTYTVTATPTGNADFTLDIAAGVAQDAGGNDNAAASQSTVSYVDSTAPTVVVSGPSQHDGVAGQTFTFTFSEPVNNFDLGDIVVTGGVATGLSGTGTTYTATITPTGTADINVTVAASGAQDAGGNGNEAGNDLPVPYVDTIAPTVTVSGPPSHDGSTPYPVTVTFSEVVTGLPPAAFNVTGGTVGAITGGPMIFTAMITPTGNADSTVLIVANGVQDGAGNGNIISNTALTSYVDSAAPSVVVSGPALHFGIPFDVTVTFSEAVTGFALGDVSVTGGTAVSVSGTGPAFTVSITPTGGAIDVSIPAGAASDTSGNPNTASNTLNVGIGDTTAPTVALTGPASHTGAAFQVTATFSETVNPITLGNITVAGGTASNLAGGPTVWTFDVTPTGPSAQVDVSIAAGATSDISGNANTASNTLNVLEAFTAYLVLSSTCHDGIAFTVLQNTVSATVTFNRAPTGFTQSDVTLTNGIVANFSGAGTTYNFDILETADADMIISIAAGAAIDGNGNPSPAVPAQAISFQPPPVITLSGAPATHDGTPFTVTYSITGGPFLNPFGTSGIAPAGLISNQVVIDANNGTFDVTPLNSVDTIDAYVVASNIVQDAGGCRIYNPESNHLVIPYEAPAVWVTGLANSGPQDATGTLGTIPVTLTVGSPQSLFTNNPVDMSGPAFTPSGLVSQPNWRAGLFNRTGTIHRILFGSAVVDPVLHFRWWGGNRNILIDTTFTLGIEILSSSAPMTITDQGGGFSSVNSISKSGSIKFLGTYTLFNPLLLSADMTSGSGGASYYFQVSAAV